MSTESPPHVCQFINSASQTSIPADIATALAKYTDVESSIITWYDCDSFAEDELVNIYSLEARDGFVDVDSYREACHLVDDIGVGILQTHHPHAGFYAKAVGLREDIPVIRTEQNTHDGYTTVGKVSNGLTNPLSARVTCISETVYDSFEWWERLLLPEQKVEILPNGVNFDRIERSRSVDWSVYDVVDVDPDSILIGNAAMLTEQKAHDTLVRALKRVRVWTGENVELVIAGDGDLREVVATLARSLGIEDSVHFAGLLDRVEVYRLMEEIDVFCMPSRWEGYCVAVAEAMALGAPCVLSDIDVFREIYDDAGLYHPVDDPNELAATLQQVITDDELRETLADSGRELVESEYRMEQIASQYETLYERVL